MMIRLPSIFLLAGCIAILQAHSWELWATYAGDWGLVWALTLEGCSLWAWFRGRWLLGTLAVVLTLAGPLGAVGMPVWKSIQKEERQEVGRLAEVAMHREAVKGLEDQRRIYLTNSTDRTRGGWAKAIAETNTRLDEERAKLAAVEAKGTEALPAFMGHRIVLLELLALMLFQAVAVLVVRSMAGGGARGGVLVSESAEVAQRPPVAILPGRRKRQALGRGLDQILAERR